jgi:hypothetical protein
VQLRRGLLVFAVFLLAVSFGAALTAPDEDPEPATTTPQTARTSSPEAVTVTFRHPLRGRPPTQRLDANAHAILRVNAGSPGNVEVRLLGLIAAVAPGTPAVFDILATRAGSYDVEFVPLNGERVRIGKLVVGG